MQLQIRFEDTPIIGFDLNLAIYDNRRGNYVYYNVKDINEYLHSSYRNMHSVYNKSEKAIISNVVQLFPNIQFMPRGVQFTPEWVKSWLNSRVQVRSNKNLKEILVQNNMFEGREFVTILLTKGLSLNDNFWVCEPNYRVPFLKITPYINPIKSVIKQYAHVGPALARLPESSGFFKPEMNGSHIYFTKTEF